MPVNKFHKDYEDGLKVKIKKRSTHIVNTFLRSAWRNRCIVFVHEITNTLSSI